MVNERANRNQRQGPDLAMLLGTNANRPELTQILQDVGIVDVPGALPDRDEPLTEAQLQRQRDIL